ncbi:hypothetical protein RF11_12626 [Thelohanellus kitauei]|uniref:Uncharacterized protein n=1 Tax=Thelohanellus kitauei TaxID=669202 RepID=A0A0C2MJJ4_THEKT|nr:hypothetical protein RF11_12626 [Thelohanellus kitauei]
MSIKLRFAQTDHSFEEFEIKPQNYYKEGTYEISGVKQLVSIKIKAVAKVTHHGTNLTAAVSPKNVFTHPITKQAFVKIVVTDSRGIESSNPPALINMAEFSICGPDDRPETPQMVFIHPSLKVSVILI